MRGVGVQRGGRFTDHLIGEDARVLASQVPGNEERRPVDVLGQHVQVDILQDPGAGERRSGRGIVFPVELRLFSHGSTVAQAFGARAAGRSTLTHFDVFESGLFNEGWFQLFRQQLGRDADCSRSIGDVDHCVIAVFGLDLHRRVRFGRGRAADHQRQVEVLALHFPGNMHHFVQ